jgi:hypothetical protein
MPLAIKKQRAFANFLMYSYSTALLTDNYDGRSASLQTGRQLVMISMGVFSVFLKKSFLPPIDIEMLTISKRGSLKQEERRATKSRPHEM